MSLRFKANEETKRKSEMGKRRFFRKIGGSIKIFILENSRIIQTETDFRSKGVF